MLLYGYQMADKQDGKNDMEYELFNDRSNY